MSDIRKIQNYLTKLNAYFLIGLLFLIPITTGGSSILSVIILISWLLIADFKNNWELIRGNPVAMTSLCIFGLHIVGLLWTEDMMWGLQVLKKSVKFLFIPIFMLYTREEDINRYLVAFLSSMILSELFSYGIWFEIIEPFKVKDAAVDNPTPFVTHIVYNPLLALAIYILVYKVFQEGGIKTILSKVIGAFFVITMIINMFITGGRSGYLGFFGMIVLLVLQRFHGQFIKALLGSSIITCSLFGAAYTMSDLFENRVDRTIEHVANYDEHKSSPVGLRMTWVISGVKVFLNHPFIGVGTGDLPSELNKMNGKDVPEIYITDNPHNMYIMEMVQFGMLGLFLLLWLFFSQIRFALSSNNDLIKHLGVALPVLYFIISFGESYLFIHNTGLMFSVMSAFLYKQYTFKS